MPDSPAHNHALSAQSRTVLLATDRQHSVVAEVVGGKTGSIAYTAYGLQSAQQSITTSLGFNGEMRETRVGWYLLGNGYRAYNPTLMRFHSPDSWSPFRGGGLNAYMYCAGDPVNFSDPTGHMYRSFKRLFVKNAKPATSLDPLVPVSRSSSLDRVAASPSISAAEPMPSTSNSSVIDNLAMTPGSERRNSLVDPTTGESIYGTLPDRRTWTPPRVEGPSPGMMSYEEMSSTHYGDTALQRPPPRRLADGTPVVIDGRGMERTIPWTAPQLVKASDGRERIILNPTQKAVSSVRKS